ncbi:hypothetical protein HK101_008887 [Irineochytrium annulatum]|nr:hypothetical protein HK101_008887 [Irineochytrium annulatum]
MADEKPLAAALAQFWANFAVNGDPNVGRLASAPSPKRPAYVADAKLTSGGGQRMRFDGGANGGLVVEVENDKHLQCAYWDAYVKTANLPPIAIANSPANTCALCDPDAWLFHGSQYDPALSLLYAERDGCIPSSVVAPFAKFVVPWRYKNRRTGEITWKIFHLSGDKITSADSETIIVNGTKDAKLRAAIARVTAERSRYQVDQSLVEFLLQVVRDTLGDYGLPGGPSSAQADASLFQQMQRQGHNLMLLCEVEIGLCRHKALLFKILCDVSEVNCALVTGYSTAGRHQ